MPDVPADPSKPVRSVIPCATVALRRPMPAPALPAIAGHDSDDLGEVARLIGRLAVAIE